MNDTYKTTYKGADIYRVDHNGMYNAYIEDGIYTYTRIHLRADTLKGIKELITERRDWEAAKSTRLYAELEAKQ